MEPEEEEQTQDVLEIQTKTQTSRSRSGKICERQKGGRELSSYYELSEEIGFKGRFLSISEIFILKSKYIPSEMHAKACRKDGFQNGHNCRSENHSQKGVKCNIKSPKKPAVSQKEFGRI